VTSRPVAHAKSPPVLERVDRGGGFEDGAVRCRQSVILICLGEKLRCHHARPVGLLK